MTGEKQERRCSTCSHKNKKCSVWATNKSEKTLSGWDKNRFAITCSDYNRKE